MLNSIAIAGFFRPSFRWYAEEPSSLYMYILPIIRCLGDSEQKSLSTLSVLNARMHEDMGLIHCE